MSAVNTPPSEDLEGDEKNYSMLDEFRQKQMADEARSKALDTTYENLKEYLKRIPKTEKLIPRLDNAYEALKSSIGTEDEEEKYTDWTKVCTEISKSDAN
uniref:Tubulin-specific chaperone A n=1 Tax=Kwoniella pini CBS 10737 TaxID=1296096 RepID=A0A1B9I795_9TREE|nr:uncharacterized protein I206_02083 [Kwoniella pini CBS 10737]OCF51369.1 hypothetical protein I206_02083 [Kwoniella pini CBS 10737]